MRESIGGTMLFWIVLFLFSIFITFMSFIIKYARVYKIKNTIVNYITRNEGVVTHTDIDRELRSMTYPQDGSYKICRFFPSDLGEYYYLELYSVSEFPIIGKALGFRVTIKGETRIINRDEKNTDLNIGTSESDWFYGTEDQCYYCSFNERTFNAGGSKCDLVDVE